MPRDCRCGDDWSAPRLDNLGHALASPAGMRFSVATARLGVSSVTAGLGPVQATPHAPLWRHFLFNGP